MNQKDWVFPITGADVSEAIKGASQADELWEILDFDVPSKDDTDAELDSLRSRMTSGSVVLSSADLSAALRNAPQVWILDVRLASDKNVVLYIEDGEVFEMNFQRTT